MCGGSDAALRLRGCEEDGRNRQAVTELEGGRIEPLAEGLLTLRTGPANNLTRFCRHPHRVRSPFSGARFRGKGRCLFPVNHDHNCHSSAIDVDHAQRRGFVDSRVPGHTLRSEPCEDLQDGLVIANAGSACDPGVRGRAGQAGLARGLA